MKDIRDEIEERLADAIERRTGLMGQIKGIDIEVETLKKMMEIESQRLAREADPSQRRVSLSTRAPTVVVGSAPDLIEKILKDGPHSKDELKEAAIRQGIFDPDNAGRAIHITLVNMMRGSRIQELPDGRFSLSGSRSPQQSDLPGAT